MFDIIKNVINSGDYNLSEMIGKIEEVYIQSKITNEQKEELNNLAREKANTNNSIDILKKLLELDKRITALENANKEESEPSKDVDTDLYPAFVSGKWYYNGDKCSENGKNYTCIVPSGQVCVWSPSDYPVYWQEETVD